MADKRYTDADVELVRTAIMDCRWDDMSVQQAEGVLDKLVAAGRFVPEREDGATHDEMARWWDETEDHRASLIETGGTGMSEPHTDTDADVEALAAVLFAAHMPETPWIRIVAEAPYAAEVWRFEARKLLPALTAARWRRLTPEQTDRANDLPPNGWTARHHRHFASDAIHRDGGPECDQPGSEKRVYVFDPDALDEHERHIAARGRGEALEEAARWVEEYRGPNPSPASPTWWAGWVEGRDDAAREVRKLAATTPEEEIDHE